MQRTRAPGCEEFLASAEARRSAARHLATLALVASTLTAATGRAEPPHDDDDDGPPRVGIMLIESAISQVIPSAFYWATREQEEIDFDLNWDWPSWQAKLTFDAVRFDTNSFYLNAVRHPLMSVIHYHIGRTNNFGMLGSTIIASVNCVIWEYVIEYREYVSLNDLIVNTVTGLQIGEPLWQIGQLWRSEDASTGDRVKTLLFSPIDFIHDSARRWHLPRTKPRAWRSFTFEAGLARRTLDDDRTHSEAVLVADLDLVSDRKYMTPGSQSGAVKPGAWSRIGGRLRLGDVGTGSERLGTQLRSRTAIAGTYHQNDAGNGVFAGLGTAFTYRRDRLSDGWDHVALLHIIGPQLQLSRRTPTLAARLDAAVYGDFAMIDAHVFGSTHPFPMPPPYVSALQANGYYYGAGVTATTRLRIDLPAWSFDAELDAHQAWQIDGADRVETRELRATVPLTAHDVADTRVYWRTQLGYRYGALGIAATADGSGRRGTWKAMKRSTSEIAFGFVLQLSL